MTVSTAASRTRAPVRNAIDIIDHSALLLPQGLCHGMPAEPNHDTTLSYFGMLVNSQPWRPGRSGRGAGRSMFMLWKCDISEDRRMPDTTAKADRKQRPLHSLELAPHRQTNPARSPHTFPISADTIDVFQEKHRRNREMKATGIVRRIDDYVIIGTSQSARRANGPAGFVRSRPVSGAI